MYKKIVIDREIACLNNILTVLFCKHCNDVCLSVWERDKRITRVYTISMYSWHLFIVQNWMNWGQTHSLQWKTPREQNCTRTGNVADINSLKKHFVVCFINRSSDQRRVANSIFTLPFLIAHETAEQNFSCTDINVLLKTLWWDM